MSNNNEGLLKLASVGTLLGRALPYGLLGAGFVGYQNRHTPEVQSLMRGARSARDTAVRGYNYLGNKYNQAEQGFKRHQGKLMGAGLGALLMALSRGRIGPGFTKNFITSAPVMLGGGALAGNYLVDRKNLNAGLDKKLNAYSKHKAFKELATTEGYGEDPAILRQRNLLQYGIDTMNPGNTYSDPIQIN